MSTVWPARYARPLVVPLDFPVLDRAVVSVTCWCGGQWYAQGDDMAEARDRGMVKADEHYAQHKRPRFWVRRAVRKVGERLVRWGATP